MGEIVILDRHVFASPASAYDTAWSTYGVTAGARSRSGRLEEEVPWGTHVTRAADPARLSGRAEAVLDPSNFDRLGQAVLPLQEWIGFSLWGAFGNGGGREGDDRDRRVLTHTLLLSEDAFRRTGGHPAGLLTVAGEPARWVRELTEAPFREPRSLEPVRVGVDAAARDAVDRSRLEELARLRRLVLGALGGDPERLREVLCGVYEALARTRPPEGGGGDRRVGPGSSPLRHVVVRGVGADTSALLRLVWLSLPLEDRLAVSFVTEQRRTERPRARLLGLPEAEWGRYVPDGSWVLGEHGPFDAAPGRAHWAESLAAQDFPDGFVRLDALARRRRWRLVGADDLDAEAGRARWRNRWSADGATVDGVRVLWEVERERPGGPRAAAVGVALGRTSGGGSEPSGRHAWLGDALELLEGLPPASRTPFLRGAVRCLRRSGTEGRARAALLRCRAAARGVTPRGELHRLVERESDALRTLLAEPSGEGGLELILAAAPLSEGGDAVGRELVRLGAAETRWTRDRARAMLDALGPGGESAGLIAEVVGTVAREGQGSAALGELADVVVPVLDARGRAALADVLARPGSDADPDGLVAALSRLVAAEAARGGGEAGVSGALLRRLADLRPPGEYSEDWSRLLGAAAPTWPGRPGTLDAFLDVLAAGRDPFGAPRGAGRSRVAADLARRLLERAAPAGLGEERAEAVLRLLWTAGSTEPLDVLRRRPRVEATVLAELLVRPAPVPLFHRVRRRLDAAVGARTPAADEGHARNRGAPDLGIPEASDGRLAAYAPAVAARLRPSAAGRRVYLALGR